MVLLWATTSSLEAVDINWSSPIAATNYFSDGKTPVTGEIVFELGTFQSGFEPNDENLADWADHWVALDRDAYNASSRFFTSKASLSDNSRPFSAGGSAYIWGFNLDAPGEWILITNPGWVWPVAISGIQPPLTWSVSAGQTTAILGEINGEGFLMKTAPVGSASPPPVWPEAWRQQHFSAAERADPLISGWEADPDGDAASTILELAAGTDPRDPASAPVITTGIRFGSLGEPDSLWVRLARSNRALIDHRAEGSFDLTSWSEAEVIEAGDTREELVWREVIGVAVALEIRLHRPMKLRPFRSKALRKIT